MLKLLQGGLNGYFKTNDDIIPLNPSNLDFRIWLAWHDEQNRIYVAFIISDDEYKNTHDWSSETATMRWLDFNGCSRVFTQPSCRVAR